MKIKAAATATMTSGWLPLLGLMLLVGCGNPADFNIASTSQKFQQNQETTNNRIDILWVVDNSGSMDPFQKNLADNFSSFISNFQTKGFDFQMAVTTSDAYLAATNYKNDPYLAQFRDGTKDRRSGTYIVTPSTPNLLDTFIVNATQGSKGSGDERAFQSLLDTLKSPLNAGFLRPGAFLAVVILSDEDDFTDYNRTEASWGTKGGIADHSYTNPGLLPVDAVISELDQLTSSTGSSRNYNVSAITITDEQCRASHSQNTSAALLGRRYIELAQKTNGVLGNICDKSFATALEFIQKRIVELVTQFRLSGQANPNTLRVIVDGQVVPRDSANGWTYVAETNSIQFHGSAVPNAGAAISVSFDPSTLD